jgi:hypothetical protein
MSRTGGNPRGSNSPAHARLEPAPVCVCLNQWQRPRVAGDRRSYSHAGGSQVSTCQQYMPNCPCPRRAKFYSLVGGLVAPRVSPGARWSSSRRARRRGGLTTKIVVVVDALGNLASFHPATGPTSRQCRRRTADPRYRLGCSHCRKSLRQAQRGGDEAVRREGDGEPGANPSLRMSNRGNRYADP